MDKGTALVVVHGVADQLAGKTAEQVSELLVASSSACVRYTIDKTETISIPVPPLQSYRVTGRLHPASPTSDQRPWFKSLIQSFRSDFQRLRWEAPATPKEVVSDLSTTSKLAKARSASGKNPSTAQTSAEPDRGLELTDYLLAKQGDNHGEQEFYTTSPVHMSRVEDGKSSSVDVFEMYWADLSRLSGSVPRIISELSTMIFRLSRLGRDTVDEARGYVQTNCPRKFAWTLLSALQSLLDWTFVNVLGQLFAQLFLFGLFVVLLGFLVPSPTTATGEGQSGWTFEAKAYLVIALALGVFGVLLFLFRRRAALRSKILPTTLIIAALAYAMIPTYSAAWTSAILLGLLTIAYNIALRVADERFPFTRFAGLSLWLVMLAIIASKTDEIFHGPLDSLNGWRDLALYGTELALYWIKLFWIVTGPLIAVWLLVGIYAQYAGGIETRASVATGRLGLGLSMCSFLAMTMASWALLTTVLDFSARNLEYQARIFVVPPERERVGSELKSVTKTAADAATPPASAASMSSAQQFLKQRYEASTEAFSLLAALLLALVAFVGGTVTPSVLAELLLFRDKSKNEGAAASEKVRTDEPPKERPASPTVQLGKWLTIGYRHLDAVTLGICAAGAVVAVVVMYVFAGGSYVPDFLQQQATGKRSLIRDLSQSLLTPLVLSAASIAAALSVLGGYLSKAIPAVRAPLDVALDVDNYFREFPRKHIPRARIFSRYAALLEHVAKLGYSRVVIVAHSQGTVISADLLRWLAYGRKMGFEDGNPDRQRLSKLITHDLRFLTLGCPLRQLYAARFPTLYRWVIAGQRGEFGPKAVDLGAKQWLNAYTSGDYVGRWLWTRDHASKDAVGHPLMESIDPAFLGRSSVYDALAGTTEVRTSLDAAAEGETCLGVGAHTHYFDSDQRMVASLVDYLVANPHAPASRDEVAAGGSLTLSPVADRFGGVQQVV